jgi:hypothetical protein
MTSKLWQRINDWLARHFRREIPPGRFEGDAKFALSGWLVSHPLVWPRREYLVYVPRGWSRWRRAPPLVCHGESRQAFAGGRAAATRDWRVGGRLVVRHVSVAGLGHAWSGGDGRFPFNDPPPPPRPSR